MFNFSITKWIDKNRKRAREFAIHRNLEYYQQSYIETRKACVYCHTPIVNSLDRPQTLECACSFWQYDNELYRYIIVERKTSEQYQANSVRKTIPYTE